MTFQGFHFFFSLSTAALLIYFYRSLHRFHPFFFFPSTFVPSRGRGTCRTAWECTEGGGGGGWVGISIWQMLRSCCIVRHITAQPGRAVHNGTQINGGVIDRCSVSTAASRARPAVLGWPCDLIRVDGLGRVGWRGVTHGASTASHLLFNTPHWKNKQTETSKKK